MKKSKSKKQFKKQSKKQSKKKSKKQFKKQSKKQSRKTKKITTNKTCNTQNKPFMELLYFYMEGCGYCKKFNPTWENLKMNIKDINLVKINGPKNRELTNQYNVRGFPTIILIKDNYKIIYRGKRDIDSLISFYKQMSNSNGVITKKIEGKEYVIN
tara:strand:- start:50 stop:517 length:468 start_codon:yes stop_codon:yes gene_type:complete